MTEQGWVRAAEAARMLGVSRERVRQFVERGTLVTRRDYNKLYVSVESIEARLADPWHKNPTGRKTEAEPKDM